MAETETDVTDEQFIREGLRLVAEGHSRGIVLRLLGSVAIRLHSQGSEDLCRASGRPLTDLDFMSYRACNEPMTDFFDSMGYEVDTGVLRHFGRHRHIYWSRGIPNLHCDVFFDRLSFCHDISFVGRLDEGETTIRPTDLLLEKMQIVEINEKDLKDSAVLLREHSLGDDERESLNAVYVADLLSKDWGFWYTFTTNLTKLESYVAAFTAFPQADRDIVVQRVTDLRGVIENRQKSTGWKLRSRVGPRKKWYRDVEEVNR